MGRLRKKTPETEAAQGFPGRRKAKTKVEVAALATESDSAAERSAPLQIPSAPDWLDEPGRKVWAVVVEDLWRRNVGKPSDLHELARYCDHCSTWQKMRSETRTKTGRLRTTYKTTTNSGNEIRRPNPVFNQMLQLEIRLKDYEDRFGLNPQARTALMIRSANIKDLPPPEQSKGTAPAAKPGSPLGLLNTRSKMN